MGYRPSFYKPLEKNEEDAVTRWAKKHGIKHRKMNGMGNRSWPDQMFYDGPLKGKVVFIEMKRKGEEPTSQQYEKLQELQDAGLIAEWFDTREGAIKFLSSFLPQGKTPTPSTSKRSKK